MTLLQRLPYDILERVFRHLRVRDCSNLRLVSRSLSDCVDYFQAIGMSMLAIPAAEDEPALLRVKRGRKSMDLKMTDLQNIAKDKEVAFIVSHLEYVAIDFDDPDEFSAQECHVKEIAEGFINILNHIEKNTKHPVLYGVELNCLPLPQCRKLVERINESNLRFTVQASVYGDPGQKGVEKKVVIGNKFKQLTFVGMKKLAYNCKSVVFQMFEFGDDVQLSKLVLRGLGAMKFNAFSHWLEHVKVHQLDMLQSGLVGKIGASITEFLPLVNSLTMKESKVQIFGGNSPKCNILNIHTEGISMKFYNSLEFPKLQVLRILIERDQKFGNAFFSKMPKLAAANIELFDWAQFTDVPAEDINRSQLAHLFFMFLDFNVKNVPDTILFPSTLVRFKNLKTLVLNCHKMPYALEEEDLIANNLIRAISRTCPNLRSIHLGGGYVKAHRLQGMYEDEVPEIPSLEELSQHPEAAALVPGLEYLQDLTSQQAQPRIHQHVHDEDSETHSSNEPGSIYSWFSSDEQSDDMYSDEDSDEDSEDWYNDPELEFYESEDDSEDEDSDDDEAYQPVNPMEFAAYITSTLNLTAGSIMVSEANDGSMSMRYSRDDAHPQQPSQLSPYAMFNIKLDAYR